MKAMSHSGTTRTSFDVRFLVAFEGKTDIAVKDRNFRC